jgi:hypothetical protein
MAVTRPTGRPGIRDDLEAIHNIAPALTTKPANSIVK